jgi:hypothetical protein
LVAALLVALTYRLVPASRWIANGRDTTTLDYALLPMFYICLIILEMGHVIAGRLVSMKFCRVQVWPLRILRGPSGLQAQWIWREAKRGSAHMLPVEAKRIAWQYGVFFAGGPAINFTILAATLALLRYGPTGLDTTGMAPILLALSFGSGFHAFAPLFPLYSDGEKTRLSDGERLWRLLKAGPHKTAVAATWAVAANVGLGTRARDVPVSFVHAALEDGGQDNNTERAEIRLFAYCWALDTGNVQEAGTQIDMASRLDLIPEDLSAAIRVEQAYYAARYRHDPVTAASLLSNARRELCPEVIVVRAEAALYLETHRYEEALEAANRALRLVDAMRVPQSLDDERDWLRQIRDEATSSWFASRDMPGEPTAIRQPVMGYDFEHLQGQDR